MREGIYNELRAWRARIEEECYYCEHSIKKRYIYDRRAFCSSICVKSYKVMINAINLATA